MGLSKFTALYLAALFVLGACAKQGSSESALAGTSSGNASFAYSITPVQPVGLKSGVTHVSAGVWHTCAIKDGQSYCWGDGTSGVLADGIGVDRQTPALNSNYLSGVLSFATQADLSNCAIFTGSILKCFGHNDFGQLGNGDAIYHNEAEAAAAPRQGYAYSIHTPQSLHVLGSTPIQQAVIGSGHACAVTTSGAVYCWGQNSQGELGNGTLTWSQIPVAVTGLNSGASSAAIDTQTSCAVVNGGVKCWGSNNGGLIGMPSGTGNALTPVPISGLNAGVTQVIFGGGSSFVCALKDGGVYCWGNSFFEEDGWAPGPEGLKSHQVRVKSDLASNVEQIVSGQNHACARKRDGSVWCWGYNDVGQLGNTSPHEICWWTHNGSTPNNYCAKEAVQVQGLPSDIRFLAAGTTHTCAIDSDGGLWCWGDSATSQLGNPRAVDHP